MVLTEVEMTAHFKIFIVFMLLHMSEAFRRCFADLFISVETQKSDPFCKAESHVT